MNEPEEVPTSVTEKTKPKCETCGKTFSKKSNLKTHMLIHSGERPHKCEICRRSFTLVGNLRKHMTVHGVDAYAWQIQKLECEKTKKTMSKREEVQTSVPEKPKPCCEICGKTFYKKSNLKSHMLIHSGERPHKCEICQRMFRLAGNLKEHMGIHSGVKAFTCQVCEKPFRSLGNLKRHLLVHSEEKQFSCDRCGKLFRTSDEVKKHMLVHTQETPYTCSVCQKKFRQSCHLGRHMLIHSGVKQHVCVICEKKFTQAEALRSHMQLHTGVRPFPCNYCEDSFKRRWQLRVHLAAKHGEEEPNNGRISCDRGETCDSIDSCDNMEACDIEASFKFQVCDNIGSSDMTDSQHSDYEQHQDKEIIIKTEPQTDEGRELKIKTEPCDSMETCDRLEPNFNFQVCDSVRSNDSESHHEDTEQHESKAIVIKAEPQTEGDEGRELKIKTEPKAEDGSSIQCDRMESRNSIQSCDMIEAYGRLESSLEETGLHKDKEMIIKTEPNTEDEASIWASSNTNNNKDNFKGGLQHESKENSQLMIGKRELHTKLRSKTIDRLHKAESKADKVHICEVCLRQFTEASSLKSHMLSHTSEEITDSKVFQKHFEYCL